MRRQSWRVPILQMHASWPWWWIRWCGLRASVVPLSLQLDFFVFVIVVFRLGLTIVSLGHFHAISGCLLPLEPGPVENSYQREWSGLRWR